MKILGLILSITLAGCATCITGIGVDYNDAGYINKVFTPSPAHTAGVVPGVFFDPQASHWPPSAVEGEIFNLVMKETGKVYPIKQGRFCDSDAIEAEHQEWD